MAKVFFLSDHASGRLPNGSALRGGCRKLDHESKQQCNGVLCGGIMVQNIWYSWTHYLCSEHLKREVDSVFRNRVVRVLLPFGIEVDREARNLSQKMK